MTDAAGAPVAGLTQPNFQVRAIVSPDGAPLNIDRCSGGGLLGCYILSVVPSMTDVTTFTWKAGTYVFGVAVTHNLDKGQALASVLMD